MKEAELSAEEVRSIMAHVHQLVDENFSPKEHMPKELYDLLQPLVVSSCQHPLPTLVMLLGAMGGVTNGAMMELWSKDPTPLSGGAFYVGDSQQGKSRLNGYVSHLVSAIDDFVANIVKNKLDAFVPAEGMAKPKSVKVKTVGVYSLTMPEFFARCNGDWPQVEDWPEEIKRFWWSTVANLDEAYEFLRELGLITPDSGATSNKEKGPNAHASTLNTLLGTGKTQRNTRTSGGYGDSRTCPVTLDILANLHPKMLIQMERGLIGNHVQETRARFLYCAGKSCKRHDALPEDFVLPPGVTSRWTWLPLSSRLAQSFGWEAYYQCPERAQEKLAPCPPEENTLVELIAQFLPDVPGANASMLDSCFFGPPGGYVAPLRDGTSLRLRYPKDLEGFTTEFRISSRWQLPSPIHEVVKKVRAQVLPFFAKARNCKIAVGKQPRLQLLGCQLEQSLFASDAELAGDTVAQAQHGAAAGQIGIWAGRIAVLRQVASTGPMTEIEISEADVDLSRRIVHISTLIKNTLRQVSMTRTGPSVPVSLSTQPMAGHLPVVGDYDVSRFADVYSSQVPLAPEVRLPSGVQEDPEDMIPDDMLAIECVSPQDTGAFADERVVAAGQVRAEASSSLSAGSAFHQNLSSLNASALQAEVEEESRSLNQELADVPASVAQESASVIDALRTAVPSNVLEQTTGQLADDAAEGAAADAQLSSVGSAGGVLSAVDGAPNVQAMTVSDLGDENEFFRKGLGRDGAMLMPWAENGSLLISDRRFLQRLFLMGRAEDTVKLIVDNLTIRHAEVAPASSELTASAKKNYKVSRAGVRDVLDNLCAQYPRIAVFSEDMLRFRIIPADRQEQVKLHNELMQSGRVTLRDFSAARASFLKKRKPTCPPAEERAAARPRSVGAINVQRARQVQRVDRDQSVTPPLGRSLC